jgi:inosine-uridine nucleoside N-ribohydrolase
LVRCMPLHLTVETEGTATLGMTMADRRALRGIRKRTPNVEAALAVDAKRALRLIQERLCRK